MSDFASKYAFALAESDSDSDDGASIILQRKKNSANNNLNLQSQQSSQTSKSKTEAPKIPSNANSRQSSPAKGKPLNKFLQNLISDSDESDGDEFLKRYR